MSRGDRRQASRPYRMQRRAEKMDDTRQRIVEAAVLLHGTVGPGATTIMRIADEAGVTRATVYRHFPDDASLFAACSSHWLSLQRAPQPAAWAVAATASDRMRLGLTDLYRFYRDGEAMLTRIYGDIALIPESRQRELRVRDEQLRDVLLDAFPAEHRTCRRLRAVVGHAVSFGTWRSLCVDHGLPNRDAVDAMVDLVKLTEERC